MTAFKDFQVACNLSMQKAMQAHQIDATKPPEVGVDARRFTPAATLQSDGDLSRAKTLKFTREAATMLVDETSIAQLAKVARDAPGPVGGPASQQAVGQLSVQWQRQLLEHHGIQMDFGCRALGTTPVRFGSDKEVMTAFQAFTAACMQSMKMAMQRAAKS